MRRISILLVAALSTALVSNSAAAAPDGAVAMAAHVPGVEGGMAVFLEGHRNVRPPVQPCSGIVDCWFGAFMIEDRTELPVEHRVGAVWCARFTGDGEVFLTLAELRGDVVLLHAAYAKDSQAQPGSRAPDRFALIERESATCDDQEVQRRLRDRAVDVTGHVVVHEL